MTEQELSKELIDLIERSQTLAKELHPDKHAESRKMMAQSIAFMRRAFGALKRGTFT